MILAIVWSQCPTIQQLDRIFLQAYAPKLQSVGGVCRFLHWQKGLGIPPSAAFGKIGDAYVAKVYLWAKAGMGSGCAGSARGKTKEQMARASGDGRVVLLGIAQERDPDRRSWKATGQEHVAPPHMEWARQMGFVNHFYFSLWTRTGAGRFGRPSPTPVAGVSG